MAGFAAAIYWIVKSMVVIPFGRYLDKNHGEKDDLWFVSIGNLLAVLAVFGYVILFPVCPSIFMSCKEFIPLAWA